MDTIMFSTQSSHLLIIRQYLFVVIATLAICCQWACNAAGSKPDPEPVVVDTTITEENAYTNRFLDSATLVRFIQSQQLAKGDSSDITGFYNSRNFQYAWFDSTGIGEQAFHFANRLTLYNEEVSNAPVAYVSGLDSLISRYISDSVGYLPDPATAEQMELLLTLQFFRYARQAFTASEGVDPKELGWFIPAKKIEIASLLDTLVQKGGRDFRMHLPVHPLFLKLRKHLAAYLALQKSGNWQAVNFTKKQYRLNDSGEDVRLLKQKLILLGDLEKTDSSFYFNEAVEKAVKRFEYRMGLKADGLADAAVLEKLNTPVETYIQQLSVNLERARWIPKPTGRAYLVVNIPEFKLHAFEGEKHLFEMNVVVGTPAHNTVIFNGNMTTVAFAPYWNVPYSIVKNEMGRTASYFSRRNMEVVGRYADGLPMVRQKPGPGNALGRVKFLFPNSYSIYLHDTPSKSLFSENKRAFSHGCIRVSDPTGLAYWVLRNQPEWTKERIDSALKGSKELQVNVTNPVPVFIGYFTAWEDEKGLLQMRPDIYGHDKKLAAKLFAATQK
jgi:murein L,D-transpeptidase YcbB/YkuD